MSTTNNRLQISAAVLLLLAGCGGGGGGSEAPKAVSASPSATTATTATNAAANTAAQRTAEQAASQAASQANVARNAANQAAAALQAAQAAAQEANAKRAEAEAELRKATAERRAAAAARAQAAREDAARKQAEAAAAAASNAAATAAANAAAQRTAEQAANQATAQANVARNAAAQATAALQAAQAAAQEANAKRAEAEAANKRTAEAEAALQKATAERRAAEEALAKAAREEAARKQAEAAAAAKAKEEADAKAKAEEEARQAAAQNAVPASSSDGVSGLLLATMLDQAMTTNRTQQANLEALPAEGTHGNLLEDADAPTVNAAQYTDPSNYVAGGQRLLGNYQPANGEYYYHLFNGGVVKAGKDAAFPMATVGIKLKVEASAEKVELDNELKVSDTIGATSIETAPTFSGGELSVQKNGLVSRIERGGVIANWFGSNGQSVQLMLAASSESGATLCWNYTLTNTNRLYCNIWQIPAGWEAGQPLSFQGYYIHETRTVDGANKNYYWHTR